MPVDTHVPVAKTDSNVVVLWPTDDSEAKPDTTKNTFSSKIDQISQQSDHLGALAWVFSANKKLLWIVHCDIKDTIDTTNTIHPWVDAYGMVSMSAINNSIVPSMKIKTSHKDNAEILLHELLHYYVNPYLYGAKEHRKWNLKVNPPQLDIALRLYDSLYTLYVEAKNKWFNVINWISIEDSLEEFVATMTNATSVTDLKRLGLYDRLFNIIQTHVSSISSHSVACTPYLSTHLTIWWMSVPRIWIWTFELWWSDKNNVEKYLTSAIKNWYRHIDTAQWYANLQQVWNAVASSGINRKEFFITSKIRPKANNKTSSTVLAAIQNQVDQTKLWHIDLMLIHARDPALTKEDMTQVLLWFKEAKRLWLIKNIWVSNFDLDQLKRASSIAPDIVCNQIECHPYSIPKDIVNYCHNKDILVTAYSPFGSDSKWGKSKDDAKQATQNIMNNPIIKEVASHYPNKSLHQVVLRYLLQQWVVTIPASSNPENQKNNLDIFDFFISWSDMKKLETINKWKDWSIYTEYYKKKWILK